MWIIRHNVPLIGKSVKGTHGTLALYCSVKHPTRIFIGLVSIWVDLNPRDKKTRSLKARFLMWRAKVIGVASEPFRTNDYGRYRKKMPIC